MADKFVLLTIGKTHTGKSTFAEKIVKKIPNCVIIETDPVALFLRKEYGPLHALDLDHRGSFSTPSLKYIVLRTILNFALDNKFNVIMSNSNMYENGRKDVLNIINNYPYKTIGIYFDYPEEILTERAENSKRATDVLSVSKDFKELIINQRERFQEPDPKNFDYFFKVTASDNLSSVKKDILKLYDPN